MEAFTFSGPSLKSLAFCPFATYYIGSIHRQDEFPQTQVCALHKGLPWYTGNSERKSITRHFWKKKEVLWLRREHGKITPLHRLQECFLLSCVLGRNNPPHQIISKYCEAETTILGKQVSGKQNRWACDLKSKRPGFESMHCHMETIRPWAGNSTTPGTNKIFLFPGVILRID